MKVALLIAFALLGTGCALFKGPKPIEGVELAFAGNQTFSRRELEDAMRTVLTADEDEAVSKSDVDDAAFEVEALYLEAGFPDVAVTFTFEAGAAGTGDAKPRAEFTIVEGPRARLADIVFSGNESVDGNVLERFFRASGSRAYVAARVKRAAVQIEDWYRSRGYVEARVARPVVTFDAERKTARVAVAIQEGLLHRLAAVDVEGAEGALPLEPDVLDDALGRMLNEPFSERLAQRVRGTIEDVYADAGYLDVKAEVTERDLGAGAVRLKVAVRPGPRVRVGAIDVQGLERTRPSFVRSRIELTSGEWYSRAQERDTFAQLFRSGIFDRVRIIATPADPAPEGVTAETTVRDVDIDVVEAPGRELWIEPGYGSYERFRVGVGGREKSLFGTGRVLDASGSVSELAQSGTLSLIDPWIFGKETTANATLFGNRRFEPSFQRLELGFELGAARRFSRELEIGLAYQYRRSDATSVDVLDPDLAANIDVSEIALRLAWDTRDTFSDPREGHLTKASAEIASDALGSQLEFFRWRAQHAHFVSLGRDTVLGASMRGGMIVPIGATDTIPLQERFFNGGESSVRSFREGRLGPKDDEGNPLGGEAFTTLSLELRQRLQKHLEAGIFVDIGNVFPQYEDMFEVEGYRTGIGLGLRYVLPVGPIRLDAALNPDPLADESRGAIHLSVGFSF